VRSVPPRVATQGPDAVDLAAVAGLFLDPWQEDVLADILAIRGGGLPAARTAALIVPRQNGKGSVAEAYVLEGMFLANASLITYTAHEYRTAQEMFFRIRQLIASTPSLDKRVSAVRLANGEQSVELRSGARLKFMARTSGSGRGFSGDRIVLDEAQHLTAAQMAALVPTLATRPHAQVLMMGSAPSPTAEVLPALMERGRAADPSVCYLEWSVADSSDQVDLDDRELWAQANPGYGIRLGDEAILAERSLLDSESFARERLGIISGGGHEAVIDRELWRRLADHDSQIAGRVTFGIDSTPDRSWTSICAAGRRADGRAHIEVIDHRPGLGWVVERLDDLTDRWDPTGVMVDPAGPAGSLVAELEERGIPVETVSAREHAQAAGDLLEAITDEQLRHLDQPPLNAAADVARRRPLGDLWAWHRRDASAVISPLVAAGLALRGSTAPPARREKTGQAKFL
jgi:phage terminase large subunit-like protein